MAHSTESATPAGRSPETVDRLMVGVCGAIWLVLLAVSAIATVALIQLGRGHRVSGGSHSSWLLYTIIAISAVVIIGAIPLLIRARRTAMATSAGADDSVSAETPEQAPDPLPTSPRVADAPTEKLRVFGAAVDPYHRKPAHARPISRINVVVERIWLRGTTSLLGSMGLALTAVATATYLLAVHTDTAAWVALGVGAAFTIGMIAVLVTFQRKLTHAAEEAANQALA